MHLSIYSLQETIFEGEAISVSLPTPLGEMTVLDHHIPMVSAVSPGEIRCTLHDSTIKALPFSGGILEVRPESNVVVLANP
ncbi:MAG: hypothetical protein HY617_00115 [Candidatus Sungbacteria bacterium]|nr:hypothetical protein [Candidatus Sungbacteria bacterium]